MTARMIVLSGARGGHGTTTVATALAVYAAGHRRTALVSADATSTAALIGIPMPIDTVSPKLAPVALLL